MIPEDPSCADFQGSKPGNCTGSRRMVLVAEKESPGQEPSPGYPTISGGSTTFSTRSIKCRVGA